MGSAVGGRVGELVGTGVGCTKKGALGCKRVAGYEQAAFHCPVIGER